MIFCSPGKGINKALSHARCLLRLSAVACFTFLQTPSLAAEEWYSKATSNCSGNLPIQAAIQTLTGGGLPLESGIDPGSFYVRLAVTRYAHLKAADKDVIGASKILNATDAATLRRVVSSVAEDSEVPLLISIGSSILLGLVLPTSTAAATDIVFSYFYSDLDAAAIKMGSTPLLIAAGGEARRRDVVRKNQGNQPYLVTSSEYVVRVGDEVRTITYFGCLYPIRVDVSEFETTGEFNNKIIRSTSDGFWRVWDLDGQRYEGDPLKYMHQSDGFYYFSRDAIREDVVVGQHIHRISFDGGPWQRKSFFDGASASFKSLYLEVLAR